MGQSPSKSEGDSRHVFRADSHINLSESLVNSLQTSSETNGTRASNLESIIQSRVTRELEKHLKSARDQLSSIADSISKEPLPKSQQPGGTEASDKSLFSRIGDKLAGNDKEDPNFRSSLDREAVAKDIESLKKKLDGRRKVVEADKEVEKAKERVVECLRLNDRRPLDCWKEVEKFKAEVSRLERSFVEKNVG